MARPPKGKPLTLRPIRLDNDVWAECRRLGKVHGTINEGLRVAFGWNSPLVNQSVTAVQVEEVASRPDNRIFKPFQPRPFKSPLLKPKDKQK
jgi:hypothetical protein